MKAKSVLLFLLMSILGLALLGMIYPKKGIYFAGKTLRFVSPMEIISLDSTVVAQLKLEEQTKYLKKLHLQSKSDSLKVFENFSKSSPSHIYYPKNNAHYFDDFFQSLDSSKNYDKIVRIVHYGDSQLEMDRITDVFREKMQQFFGGYGTGILPAIQNIPKFTVTQFANGNLSRYAINDSTRIGMAHRKFGMMGMFSELQGSASISFNTSKKSSENTRFYNRLKLLVNIKGNFSASLKAGKNNLPTLKIDSLKRGVKLLQWNLNVLETKGVLSLQGNADIYGFSLEGNKGVVIDNIALRGSSGEFFSGIDSLTFTDGLRKMECHLILLQFGGNAMPVIRNQNRVDYYVKIMARQVEFLKNSFPNSKIMFLGPADMSLKINGKFQTRPFLPELNIGLKEMASEHGIAYWDLYHTMGGENSMIEWVKSKPSLANSDYTHFSQKGADLVGEMLYTAIYNDYKIYQLTHQLSKIEDVASKQNK